MREISRNTPDVSKLDLAKSAETELAEPSEYELQMRSEFKRYTYLRDELKKLPQKDVEQWHNEGKLTEDQYNKFMDTYKAIQDEMEDIRKRVRVLNQTSAYQKPKQEQKKEKTKKPGMVARVIAWVSSILLVTCAVTSGVYIHNLTADYNKLENSYNWVQTKCDNYEKQYMSKSLSYYNLKELYESQSEDLENYRDKYWDLYLSINSKLKIGDSEQVAINKCGSPTSMVERFKSWGSEDGWTLYYGTSYVLIDTYGKVEGWYVGNTELPVG